MNAFLGSRRLWKVLHSSLRFSRAFWKIAVTTMCGGVHQMFCCALTTNHSLKPPGSVLLVNTTPSNSWSWLLSSGNGFVLVVSWQSAGDLSTEGGAGNHLAWGGGYERRERRWCWWLVVVEGSGGTFSAHWMEVFCQCHGLLLLPLPLGWLVHWWKLCQWSETSTTVTHVVTHSEGNETLQDWLVCMSHTVRGNCCFEV